MAAVMPITNAASGNPDLGRPGQQLLPGYVVKLLKTLKIPFGTDRTLSGVDVDPTVNLISHIIDCLGALRDVNKVYRAKGSLAARSVGTRVLYGYTSELGNILLDAITFDPPQELVDSCVYYSQIAGSILNVFPEIAAQVTPSTGKVLLHHTALKTSPIMASESIKMVLKAFPAGAWTADKTGALPLHWITHNSSCNQAMISSLIAANPKGPWVADTDGYLPLHWAVNQDDPNVDVVAALISANPSASSKACGKGSLPLHWCVNRDRVHMGVLRALVQVHPDGVRTFDKTGWLPIHQCVNRSQITIEAMQQLIELYPQGLQCPNSNGQVPLHRALDQAEPNLDAVHMLLQAFPGAAKVADDEGYLPLHLALDCARPNVHIASLLLEHYPEAAFHKSKDGLLPIHCIISAMYPVVEIIQLLLQIFPDSCESMAVDVIPADEGADPENWQGDWVERRWTPLSRAIDRGLDAIVILFRDALNNGARNENSLAMDGRKSAPSRGIPNGPNNTATSRALQPQAQPPIHNLSHLMDQAGNAMAREQEMMQAMNNLAIENTAGADPGPSTSSIDGPAGRNRLMLGGTLDMDEDNNAARGTTTPRRAMQQYTTSPMLDNLENGAANNGVRLSPLIRPPSQGAMSMKDRAPGGLRGQQSNANMVDMKQKERERERSSKYDREEERERRRGRSSSKHRGGRDEEYERRRSSSRRRSSRGRDRGRDREYYDDEGDYYEGEEGESRPRRSAQRRDRDRDRERDRRDRDRSSSRQRESGRDRGHESRRVNAERIYEDQEFDHDLGEAQDDFNRPVSAGSNKHAPSEPPPKSLREAAANNIVGSRGHSASSRNREREDFLRSRDPLDNPLDLDEVV